jgi:hypothetical protein
MLKLNYNLKVVTSRNVGKKDLVNGYGGGNQAFKRIDVEFRNNL